MVIKAYLNSLIIALAIFACSKAAKDDLTTIDENFRQYLFKAFNKKPENGVNYYVVNMGGGADCVEEHLAYLNTRKVRNEVVFILAGRVKKMQWLEIFEKIQLRNKVLIDNSNLSGKYYFGLNKPLLFRYQDDKLISLVSINSPVDSIILNEVFIVED